MTKEQEKDLAFVQTNISYTDKTFYHYVFKKEYRFGIDTDKFRKDLRQWVKESFSTPNSLREKYYEHIKETSTRDAEYHYHGISHFEFNIYHEKDTDNYKLYITPIYWRDVERDHAPEEDLEFWFYINDYVSLKENIITMLDGMLRIYIYDDNLRLAVVESKTVFVTTDYELVQHDKGFDKDVLDKIKVLGNLVYKLY